MVRFALFPTPLGRCGIAWSERGVVAVQLPEADEATTRARLLRRWPEAVETPPPQHIEEAIASIASLLRGEAGDLAHITLDMDRVEPFQRRVYEAARRIPPGATLTYGEVAARFGDPTAARAVGQALAENPFPLIVPCHRVVAAGGKLGGFSANGGVSTKLRLLSIEGAQPFDAPTLFPDLPLASGGARRS